VLKEKKWGVLLGLLLAALGMSLILPACTSDQNDGANSTDEADTGVDFNDAPLTMNPADSQVGLAKIQHFVFILQEDRSFDSYFGNYPGAEGVSKGIALTDPLDGTRVPWYHNANDIDTAGPHSLESAVRDINGGQMDGFLNESYNAVSAGLGAALDPKGVMGYHDYREIPNYWNYAMLYVLQDNLFAPTGFSSLALQLSRLAQQGDHSPISLSPSPVASDSDEITRLFTSGSFEWKYYQGSEQAQKKSDPNSTLQDGAQFYMDARQGRLPQVSWITPSSGVSEAPPASVRKGMAYVTGLINAVMQGPEWYSTAIFVSWDNWGGFYDHLAPPPFLEYNSAIRVPGLVISPYAKQNFVDHQTYSLESWLRIVEERFQASSAASGNSNISDMQAAFDFNQRPRVPIILAPTEGGSIFPQPLQHPEL
jgi:phospholipase C